MKMYKKIIIEIIMTILALVGIAFLLPSISESATDAELASGLYNGWANGTITSASFSTSVTADMYLIGSNYNLYCVNHSGSLRSEKIYYQIKIRFVVRQRTGYIYYDADDENKFITWTSDTVGKLNYVLNAFGWPLNGTSYDEGNGKGIGYGYGTAKDKYTKRQIAVWKLWNTFIQEAIDTVKSKDENMTIEMWTAVETSSGYVRSSTTTTKKLVEFLEGLIDTGNDGDYKDANTEAQAEELLDDAEEWAKSIPTVSSTSKEITCDYNMLGPFNLTYTGTGISYKVTDTNGSEISSSYLSVVDANGNTTTIQSGKSFYIKNTSSNIPASITFTVSGTPYVSQNDIYVFESLGAEKQNLIAHDSGWNDEQQAATVTITLNCRVYTNIAINKTDAETQAGIEGIGFTIQNSQTGYYLKSDGTQTSTYTVLYTDASGKISISDIEVTTTPDASFIVTEVASNNEYYHPYTSITQTIQIVKNGTMTFNLTNTKDYKLTILKADNYEKSVDATFAIYYVDDGTWLSGSADNATYGTTRGEFTTTNGTLTLSRIKRGTYHIYEVAINHEAFELDEQDAYDSENDWVDFGTVVVGDSDATVTVSQTVVNIPNIIITGFVWLDENDNKIGEYNAEYDEPDSEWDGEVLVEGVTVRLMNKDGTEVASTTTDSNGAYEFRYLVNYDDLAEYYIEFDYSQTIIINAEDEVRAGTEYIPVAYNSEDASELIWNGSRALMDDVAYLDEDLSGKATTYIYSDTEGETSYGLSGNILEAFYNPDTYTLPYINLGLLEIYDPSYTISEDLDYIQIVYNDYVYTYEYGDCLTYDTWGDVVPKPTPTVRFESDTEIGVYTKEFYPSDLYAWAEGEASLEVYVVYSITVVNTTAYNVPIRYSEQYLHIESLSNDFDSYRYTLNTDYDSGSYFDTDIGDQINSDIASWTTANDNYDGTATTTYTGAYTDGNTDRNGYTYEDGSFDVYYGSPVTKYIQFEVTDDAKRDILETDAGYAVYETYPTSATTVGFHIYQRNDWSWQLNIYGEGEEHRTKEDEEHDSAGYLGFTLNGEETPDTPDERTISGTVFEDDIVDSDTDGEKLGNGYKDERNFG